MFASESFNNQLYARVRHKQQLNMAVIFVKTQKKQLVTQTDVKP